MSQPKRSHRAAPTTQTDRPENPVHLNIDFRNKGEVVIYDRIRGETVYEETAVQDKKDKDLYNLKTKYKVLFFDQLYFLQGMDSSREWFGSTMYRYKGDNISIFQRGENRPVLKDVSRDSQEVMDFQKEYDVNLSVGVYVFGMLADGRLCRIQLTASTRNFLFSFQQEHRNDTGIAPDFQVTGFRQCYEGATSKGKRFLTFDKESNGKKNKPMSLIPVLEEYTATDIEIESADLLFPKMVAYLGTPINQEQAAAQFTGDGYEAADKTTGEAPADDLPF